MGWEPINPKRPTKDALLGDEPFDALAEAIEQAVGFYQRDLGRKPSLFELVTTFERALEGQYAESVREGQNSELVSISFKTKKIPKRQKWQVGDFLVAEAANGQPVYGRVFATDPMGLGVPMIGVYDSLGLKRPSLKELKRLPLIVKVSTIHPELLEKRSWRVIGHLPIGKEEEKHPRRSEVSLSGSNNQLIAANRHYGLPHKTFFGIGGYLVKQPRKRGS